MIEILRLNHRLPRDSRTTTHVALTARAFGATAMYYTGMRDQAMEKGIQSITTHFGGPFTIQHIPNDKILLQAKKKEHFTIVHLTMYGTSFTEFTTKHPNEHILLIVGGEKVPPHIYQLADYNISIGNQPHSEVAALGIFLNAYHGPQEKFTNAQQRVIGMARGKKVEEL